MVGGRKRIKKGVVPHLNLTNIGATEVKKERDCDKKNNETKTTCDSNLINCVSVEDEFIKIEKITEVDDSSSEFHFVSCGNMFEVDNENFYFSSELNLKKEFE